MDCSMPVFPVLYYLLALAQTHVHWVGDAIWSSSPFLLLPSIFPSIRVFSNEWLFTPGGQSIGASALASALPMNIQDWFPLGLTGLISLQSKGISRVFSNTSLKASVLRHLAFSMVQLSHPYMTTEKTIALTIWTVVAKVMTLLFNMLSRLVIAFLTRSMRLLISWLHSPSAVILDPKKTLYF